MCLLAEFDFQTLDFGILNEHAGMVRILPVCVQPPRQNLRSVPEDDHGFTGCLPGSVDVVGRKCFSQLRVRRIPRRLELRLYVVVLVFPGS